MDAMDVDEVEGDTEGLMQELDKEFAELPVPNDYDSSSSSSSPETQSNQPIKPPQANQETKEPEPAPFNPEKGKHPNPPQKTSKKPKTYKKQTPS